MNQRKDTTYLQRNILEGTGGFLDIKENNERFQKGDKQ